jgi:hypothetical protein
MGILLPCVEDLPKKEVKKSKARGERERERE